MIGYVLKTLWRHRTRTLLTVSGAAVAMFVFCFVGSVQEGLHRLTTGSDADRSLIVFQENRFCPTTSRLPEDYATKIREINGVRDVMPIQVWTNNCRASLDIVVFNGADPIQIQKSRPLTLVSGSWQQFQSQRDAAIVGRNVANRRGLKVGDQFSIGDISVRIAGLFSSTVPSEENLIYTSLAFLQYARGLNAAGLVTQHEVQLTDDADPDRVASEIDSKLRAGAVATKTRRKGAFQASTLSDLVDLIGFAHWLGYACVGLVLSLVATTTVMSVQDRIKEYAVLQTIGVRPLTTMRLVLTESTLLCLVGGVTGTLLAMLALSLGGFAIGAEGATIAFRPSVAQAFSGSAISLCVGVISGLPPAIQASTISIVHALRQS
ncbi:Macrolide export ATP-binding/permease protein MacB [Pirellula sp. SH-Sr6A]|jgi:putative ABC transport system permease protein|uniref:ABC transporter permease n=1 Tax=Pirellula sp. SH-Sr6A TaxID=1632865 RepID=UPI00078CC70D|nr:ABC transporter permease [Pirellula sp. SH-Sr6A]AMV31605.1 Macrolide export ATP-binding/permease protein MacB [Pirellula sp. SH-Sr6A]MBL8868257.1 ABC transporter permease [Planctomycetaceae bacterium]MBX3421037.1 ABC transporter permease [Pirellulaceae bacterium]RLS72868.1 MAG: ABC transporter permease [Planctomycetota bacterium]